LASGKPGGASTVLDDVRSAGSIGPGNADAQSRGKVSTMLASGVIIEFDAWTICWHDGGHHPAQASGSGTAPDVGARMELSQLKSNFVSMVSHEFRTPLGIIQSSAELLHDFYQKMPPPNATSNWSPSFGTRAEWPA